MLPIKRTWAVCLLLISLLFIMCGCKQNPDEDELYARMIDYFAKCGYTCDFAEAEEGCEVPIYNSSAWRKLLLGEEEVLVYFDESNRADYLSQGIDPEAYSFVGQFGLRFVLVYSGDDPAVLQALEAIPEV